MDALFLNLHREYLNQRPKHGGFLGIFLLAAFLNANGYEAKAFAGSLREGHEIIDGLHRQTKLLGLYADYVNGSENLAMARLARHYGLKVIIGGPSATSLKAELQQAVDAIVLGEGELTVLELCHHYLDGVGALADIRGLAYFDGRELRRTDPRPLIENLDALPFIDDNCCLTSRDKTSLSLMTGRGCPFSCTFCHEGSHSRRVRLRSVANVLAELDANPQASWVMFTDDTLTLDPARLRELCDGIAERRRARRLTYFAEGHVHTLYQHPEMIDWLAQSGIYRLQLGIEAGTQKVLDAYNKHTTPDEIRAVVSRCEQAGVWQTYGNIIVGSALFSREVYERDRAFAKELLRLSRGTLELGVVSYWPLPETRLASHPAEYGLTVVDPDFVTTCDDYPQTETAELSRADIAKMQRDLQRELRDSMLSLLREGAVPKERVLAWFNADDERNRHNMWYYVLRDDMALYNYYGLMAKGEATDERRGGHHPMRTAPLYSSDYECSGLEWDTLLLCTGKLSVDEILSRLPDAAPMLDRLLQNHQIIYAKE